MKELIQNNRFLKQFFNQFKCSLPSLNQIIEATLIIGADAANSSFKFSSNLSNDLLAASKKIMSLASLEQSNSSSLRDEIGNIKEQLHLLNERFEQRLSQQNQKSNIAKNVPINNKEQPLKGRIQRSYSTCGVSQTDQEKKSTNAFNKFKQKENNSPPNNSNARSINKSNNHINKNIKQQNKQQDHPITLKVTEVVPHLSKPVKYTPKYHHLNDEQIKAVLNNGGNQDQFHQEDENYRNNNNNNQYQQPSYLPQQPKQHFDSLEELSSISKQPSTFDFYPSKKAQQQQQHVQQKNKQNVYEQEQKNSHFVYQSLPEQKQPLKPQKQQKTQESKQDDLSINQASQNSHQQSLLTGTMSPKFNENIPLKQQVPQQQKPQVNNKRDISNENNKGSNYYDPRKLKKGDLFGGSKTQQINNLKNIESKIKDEVNHHKQMQRGKSMSTHSNKQNIPLSEAKEYYQEQDDQEDSAQLEDRPRQLNYSNYTQGKPGPIIDWTNAKQSGLQQQQQYYKQKQQQQQQQQLSDYKYENNSQIVPSQELFSLGKRTTNNECDSNQDEQQSSQQHQSLQQQQYRYEENLDDDSISYLQRKKLEKVKTHEDSAFINNNHSQYDEFEDENDLNSQKENNNYYDQQQSNHKNHKSNNVSRLNPVEQPTSHYSRQLNKTTDRSFAENNINNNNSNSKNNNSRIDNSFTTTAMENISRSKRINSAHQKLSHDPRCSTSILSAQVNTSANLYQNNNPNLTSQTIHGSHLNPFNTYINPQQSFQYEHSDRDKFSNQKHEFSNRSKMTTELSPYQQESTNKKHFSTISPERQSLQQQGSNLKEQINQQYSHQREKINQYGSSGRRPRVPRPSEGSQFKPQETLTNRQDVQCEYSESSNYGSPPQINIPLQKSQESSSQEGEFSPLDIPEENKKVFQNDTLFLKKSTQHSFSRPLTMRSDFS